MVAGRRGRVGDDDLAAVAVGGGIYIATRPSGTTTPPKVEAPPPKKDTETKPKQETAKKSDPTPKKESPPPTPSQGTLLVTTGIAGADVFQRCTRQEPAVLDRKNGCVHGFLEKFPEVRNRETSSKNRILRVKNRDRVSAYLIKSN